MSRRDGPSEARAEVAIVGVPVVDMVAYVEQFPVPGGHSPGSSLDVAPGGPAVNVATGTARLGHRSVLLGKVGSDPLGELLVTRLREEGVDLPGPFIVAQAPTATVLVLYDQNGQGEMRSFSFREGSADRQLGAADIEPALFDGVRALFLDGVLAFEDGLTAAGLRAAELAREKGCRVFMDPNVRVPGKVLPSDQADRLDRLVQASDEVLMNLQEAAWLAGVDPASAPSVYALGATLAERHPAVACWVIKQGEAGCTIFFPDGILVQPAVPTSVSDTSGAGDSFDAAWMAAFLEGMGRKDAARFASTAASLTVAGKGAWRSLPRRAQVDASLSGRARGDG